MKSSKASNVIGIISTILLGIANVCNLFFTICLLIEQIETGWGFSTNYEMLVLVPLIFSVNIVTLCVFLLSSVNCSSYSVYPLFEE